VSPKRVHSTSYERIVMKFFSRKGAWPKDKSIIYFCDDPDHDQDQNFFKGFIAIPIESQE